MRVCLFGEGNTDVTAGNAATEGALKILLKKLIESRMPYANKEIEIVGMRLPRLQRGSGYSRKVSLAVRLTKDADAIAIVIDRDGPKNSHRLSLLQEGRELAERDAVALAARTSLGVAIEMLEAWLLADTKALAAVAKVKGASPNPETISNPKATLNQVLDGIQIEIAHAFDRIAEAADVQVIRERCPAFNDFAQEVDQRIVQRPQ